MQSPATRTTTLLDRIPRAAVAALALMASAANGQRAATASADAMATTPRLVVQSGPRNPIGLHMALSPDKRLVATAGGERSAAYVWQVETGRLLCILKADMDRDMAFMAMGAAPMAFSADGNALATGNHQGVSVWDLRQCRLRIALPPLGADAEGVTSLLTLADGRLLASTEGGRLYRGDVFAGGGALRALPQARQGGSLLHGQTSDGRLVLVSGSDSATNDSPLAPKTLAVADVDTGAMDPLATYRGVQPSSGGLLPRSAALSRSGRWVLESQLGVVTLYDRQSRTVAGRVQSSPDTSVARASPPAASAPAAPVANTRSRMNSRIAEAMKALSGMDGDFAKELQQTMESMAQAVDTAKASSSKGMQGSTPGWMAFSEKEDQVYLFRSRRQGSATGGPAGPDQAPVIEVRRVPTLELVKEVPLGDPSAVNPQAAGEITSFAMSTDGSSLAVALITGDVAGGRTGVLDLTQLPAQAVIRAWKPTGNGPGRIAWTPEGNLIALHGGTSGSAATASLAGRQEAVNAPSAVTPSARTVLVRWSLDSGEVATRSATDAEILPLAVSPRGAFMAKLSAPPRGGEPAAPGYRIEVVDTQTQLPRFESILQGIEGEKAPELEGIALSPDGRRLAVLHRAPDTGRRSARQRLSLHDTATGRVLAQQSLPWRAGAIGYQQPRMRFAADGKTILVVGDKGGGELLRIEVSDTGALKVEATKVGGGLVDVVGEGPFRLLTRGGRASTASPAGMDVIALPDGDDGLAASNPEGTQLALALEDGNLQLFDVAPGGRIGQAARLSGHAAKVVSLAFSPDGSRLASSDEQGATFVWDLASGTALARLFAFTDGSWAVVDAQGRFDTNNLEELEYLHWVMPDDPLRALPLDIFMREYFSPGLLARIARGEPLPAVRPVGALNRAQPIVRIVSITPARSDPRRVDVTVEAEGQADAGGRPGGVADLRLFRDGRLVGSPQRRGEALPLDARTRRASVVFRDIRLPLAAERTTFSAYAFNLDQVKSPTARREYLLPGAGASARPKEKDKEKEKGKAYVIAIGVNTYENPAFNLQFAVNDARLASDLLSSRLTAGRQYREVVTVPLVSDGERARDATKARIRAVLAVLAGKPADRNELAGLPGAARLEAATPDDLVIITFAGHGHAGDAGDFYLLPQDIGPSNGLGITPALLGKSIGSEELEEWLRDVDAGDMAMVIDACHSAASVEGDGFKPGPMGSRGLGQLAYDKGMRILAASQANDVALEAGPLLHGLLTFTLMRDGIEARRADFKPADKRIELAEWLAFGVEGVPQLQRELADGQRAANGQVRAIVRVAASVARVQQPRLFDFSRRANGPTLEMLR